MGRPVFPDADRIVREDGEIVQFHQGRQPDRRPHVVGEDQEGRAERAQAGERHAVADRAHAVLANAEMHVAAARRRRAERFGPLDRRLGRRREIGGAADEPGAHLGDRVDHLAGGFARRETFLVGGEDGQRLVPALGHRLGADMLDLAGGLGVRRFERRESPLPLVVERGAALADVVVEMLADALGHEELRVLRPAVGFLRTLDLVFARRIRMRLVRAGLGREAVADDRMRDDDGRALLFAEEALEMRQEARSVVGVREVQDVPTVGFEALADVFGEGERGVAFDRDLVVVVDPTKVGQAEMSGQRRRLGGDAFHQVAVRAEIVNVVVEEGCALVVGGAKPAARHRHAHRVTAALAERAGRRLDAGGEAVFGMAWCLRIDLAECLKVVNRQRRRVGAGLLLDAGKEDQRVEQHRRVADGQHESVAVRPIRIGRIVAEHLVPQRVGHRCQSHRRAGMPALRLLHGVHRQGADRVDREQIDVARRFRRCRHRSLRSSSSTKLGPPRPQSRHGSHAR